MIGRNEFAEQPVRLRASLLCTCAIILSGCSNDDASNGDEDFGPRPVNPEQTRYLVPQMRIVLLLAGRTAKLPPWQLVFRSKPSLLV